MLLEFRAVTVNWMGIPAVAFEGAVTEKCVAVPGPMSLTTLKTALINRAPPPELTVSGLV